MTVKCRANPRSRALSRLGAIAAPHPLVLAIAAALAFASCGGGDDAELLSGGTAREITTDLDNVEQLADEGECLGAEDAAEEVALQVETLRGVDAALKRALERGAERLNEVVETCEEASEELPPVTVPGATDREEKREEKEREKEEKELEKEEEQAEKEEEKEEDEEGEGTGPPEEAPPPHSNGQGQGPEGEGGPSGGISPGNAVGGDD